MQIPVAIMIFTLNEEENLPRCLGSLGFSDDLVVVDSYSEDKTLDIAREYGARVIQHEFQGFGTQRNWALRNIELKYDWVFVLDADERVDDDLRNELAMVLSEVDISVAAFMVKRRFYMWGKWMKRSGLYPTYVVRLIRKDRVRYINRGHAETQEVNGEIRQLECDLIDESRKGVDAWFDRQNAYSTRDAQYELSESNSPFRAMHLISADPLIRRASLKRIARSLPGRPIWYFLYSYLLRGGILEGRDGLALCAMRAYYQGMVSVKKHDLRRKNAC
jgi:glycosyltransferase involved in cell wall biosynthesis